MKSRRLLLLNLAVLFGLVVVGLYLYFSGQLHSIAATALGITFVGWLLHLAPFYWFARNGGCHVAERISREGDTLRIQQVSSMPSWPARTRDIAVADLNQLNVTDGYCGLFVGMNGHDFRFDDDAETIVARFRELLTEGEWQRLKVEKVT